MYKNPCLLKGVPRREIALRIFVYGTPITPGIASYFLG